MPAMTAAQARASAAGITAEGLTALIDVAIKYAVDGGRTSVNFYDSQIAGQGRPISKYVEAGSIGPVHEVVAAFKAAGYAVRTHRATHDGREHIPAYLAISWG